MKRVQLVLCLLVLVFGVSPAVFAQITNSGAALTSSITTSLSGAYDAGVSILIASIGVGAAVMYVRRGFKGRA